MKDLTIKIMNGMNISDLQTYVNNDARNSLIYPSDVNQLISYGSQFYMTYNYNKGIAERNRYEF